MMKTHHGLLYDFYSEQVALDVVVGYIIHELVLNIVPNFNIYCYNVSAVTFS